MSERDPDDLVRRGELEEALRFVHAAEMRNADALDRIDAVLAALVRALLESGTLEPRSVDRLLPDATASVREQNRDAIAVDVAPTRDKYAVASPPDLDCEALLPLCHGRCCRLTFPLSFQDLDEGGIQWEYGRPYRIRQRDDGYCVHADPDSRRCGVYQRRPAVCRSYDCRTDTRIWTDFERRIPAPDAIIAPERLFRSRRERMDEPGSGDDG